MPRFFISFCLSSYKRNVHSVSTQSENSSSSIAIHNTLYLYYLLYLYMYAPIHRSISPFYSIYVTISSVTCAVNEYLLPI